MAAQVYIIERYQLSILVRQWHLFFWLFDAYTVEIHILADIEKNFSQNLSGHARDDFKQVSSILQ